MAAMRRAKSIIVLATLLLSGCTGKQQKSSGYEHGVNDALDCFMLLNLEQDLQRTNRTMGAMGEIVAQRLSVKRFRPGESPKTL